MSVVESNRTDLEKLQENDGQSHWKSEQREILLETNPVFLLQRIDHAQLKTISFNVPIANAPRDDLFHYQIRNGCLFGT